MFSKRGWAVVDKVSGDIVEVSFKETACDLVIRTIAEYEKADREDGKKRRGYLNKYFAKDLEIRRVEIRLVKGMKPVVIS